MVALDFDKIYSFKPPCSDLMLGGIVYTGKLYDYAKFFYTLDYPAIYFSNSQLDTLEKRNSIPRRLLQRKREFKPIEDKHQHIYLMRENNNLRAAREYRPCTVKGCQPCLHWYSIPDTAINGHNFNVIGEFV